MIINQKDRRKVKERGKGKNEVGRSGSRRKRMRNDRRKMSRRIEATKEGKKK